MRVFSAFDGISCGQVALERAGIPITSYFSSEIDPHAISVTQKHYPLTVQVGDIRQVKGNKHGKIDLLLAGSPCQDLSCCSRDRQGLAGEKSGLFFEFIRVKEEMQPENFLFENVASMTKANRDIITRLLGVEPLLINSSLLSAQQRPRLYWTNMKGVTLPDDNGVTIDMILEEMDTVPPEYEVGAKFWKGQDSSILPTGPAPYALTERRTEEARKMRREFQKEHGRDFSPRRGKEMAARFDRKANCLTTSLSREHVIWDGKRFRKLTPLEFERLQTLPDNYTASLSRTQRYAAVGNGWTVDVIAHILKGIV
jgi:DNA (cytosine-5)-methyltransferase 3A